MAIKHSGNRFFSSGKGFCFISLDNLLAYLFFTYLFSTKVRTQKAFGRKRETCTGGFTGSSTFHYYHYVYIYKLQTQQSL